MNQSRTINKKTQQKKHAILNAARTIFYQKGFLKTTVHDIAKKAGIAKGTVYLYFSRKEDICFALSKEAFDILDKLFEKQISKSNTGLEKIIALGKAYFYLYTHDKHRFKILQECEVLLTERYDAEKTEAEHALIQHKKNIIILVAHLIQQGQKDGSIRKDLDPGKTAIILLKTTRLYILTTTKQEEIAIKEHNTTKEEMIEYFFTFISQALQQT